MRRTRKSTSALTSLFEDTGELLNPKPGKPTRRVKVLMSLLSSAQARTVPPTTEPTSQTLTTNTNISSSNNVISLLVVPAKGSSAQRFAFGNPFFAQSVPGYPDQLRIFKDPISSSTSSTTTTEEKENTVGCGTCLILFPTKPVNDWIKAINESQQRPNQPPTQQQTSSTNEVRIFIESNSSASAASVQWTSQILNLNGSMNISKVLDIVINRRLGEIPTQFFLCWSSQGKHCLSWKVADSGPVSLQTFTGSSLYILPRKIDPIIAIDEWFPNLRNILIKWGKEAATSSAQTISTSTTATLLPNNLVIALAESFIGMSDRTISRLYESVHRPSIVPLHLSFHLHGFDETVNVRKRETVIKFISVTNQTSKQLIVFAELSTMFAASDGVQIVVLPRSIPVAEGSTRIFKVIFTGTADSASEKKNSVHCISFTYTTTLGEKPKERQQIKDTPFIVPFKYAVLPITTQLEQAAQLPIEALESMSSEEPLASVQSCKIDKVMFQGSTYLRKLIKLDNDKISLEKIKEELISLDEIAHPNIAKIMWHVHDPRNSCVFLLMPMVYPLWTLRDAVLSSHIPDFPLKIKIAIDVASALKHLHHFSVAYGDLRPESVLVVSLSFAYLKFDGSCSTTNAILSDFGLVDNICLTRLKEHPTDSIPFFAPELITMVDGKLKINLAEKQTASDIYAFAMILYMLISQQVPFAESRATWGNQLGLMEQVSTKGFRPGMELVPRECPQSLVQLMTSCWSAAPASRPNADKIIEILYKAITPFIMDDSNWKTAAAEKSNVPSESPKITPIPPPASTTPTNTSASNESISTTTSNTNPVPISVTAQNKTISSETISIALELPLVVVSEPVIATPNSSPPTETKPSPLIIPMQFTPPPQTIPEITLTNPPPQTTTTTTNTTNPRSPISIQTSFATNSKSSVIVRVVSEQKPVQVRVPKDSSTIHSLLEALKRSRVSIDGKTLTDALTKVALTDKMLSYVLSATETVYEVSLRPSNEMVNAKISLSSPTNQEEEEEEIHAIQLHKTAKASEIASAYCIVSQMKCKFHILLPDCTAANDNLMPLEQQQQEISTPPPPPPPTQPLEIVLAAEQELTNVVIKLLLAGKEERKVKVLFHQSATLSAVSRWALQAFEIDPDQLPYPLELSDPTNCPIADPALVTVQTCFAAFGKGSNENDNTEHELTLRDGELITVTYYDKPCKVLLPAAVPMTIANLVQKACEVLNLPKENEHFICTSTGVALLDLTANVDRQFHTSQTLKLCDQNELLQVTVNDNFAVGFSQTCNPTIRSLTDTMGLNPSTPIALHGIVQETTNPIVPDGSYFVADLSSSNFRVISITLPKSSATANEEPKEMKLTSQVSCTLADILNEISEKVPHNSNKQETAVFIDVNDSCILDSNITLDEIPPTTKLSLSFI